MPPKTPSLPAPTAQLGLQEWLKLLASRGVDMRIAMGLAAKIYKSHGTIERLSELTPQKLAPLIEDKDARKTVLNAVRGLAAGEPVVKKRGRDGDLLEPLKTGVAEPDVPLDMDFHFVMDVEQLLPLSLTTNRAPVSTAWSYTICQRLGFDHLESLSIAQTYVHINSLKHALMLGNILGEEETREAEREVSELPGAEKEGWGKKGRDDVKRGRGRGWKGKGRQVEPHPVSAGSAQPWVGLMRAKPIIERPDGTCRAIQKGVPVGPSQAYLYITKTFKDYTPHVLGAMKVVADSYEPEELNRLGLHLYNDFKPDVVEWGQRGILELARVLETVKGPIVTDDEKPRIPNTSSPQVPSSDPIDGTLEIKDEPEREEDEEPRRKKVKVEMTVEEYEALLDAEDGAGGFLEGGDIVGAVQQVG
ncbi:hypothetical protein CI109_104575 [Kwoniella shandongensis]|uniref:Uncharacterized protein n=1 Tax=Kwoniella shandongensis TaxID=1734106 RepID=A0A5M6BV52_9TREE|nr:uncharacterized protein CI109_005535 [Kwoniella shandongensis]KAA5526101.1 hypothetical protein CI109_005535 [Kwoniella shandongensis]